MEIWILATAFVIEAALTGYSVATRANQTRLRSLVRIGALVAFVGLTLVSVIEWGSRWFGLAALLAVWAALGIWMLAGKREEPKGFQAGRSVGQAVVALLLVAIVTAPALIFPQYQPIEPTGQYPVASVLYTYTDASRVETYASTGENRKLNVELWYPQDADGTYPLIVFSHGSMGIKTSNATLFRELASHGYVVCSVDHTYQSLFTTFPDGHTTWIDPGYLKEIQAEDARTNKPQSLAYYQEWMKLRSADLNFVIDTILAEAKKDAPQPAYRRIDPKKLGVMGHSLGGSAALALGRQRADVGAVLSLEAPFMYDIEGVKDGSFVWNERAYPVPVLNVYSDGTWGILGDRAQYAENFALLASSSPSVINVHIGGVGHLTLTDLALESPFLANLLNGKPSTTPTADCLRQINQIGLEFFDRFLK